MLMKLEGSQVVWFGFSALIAVLAFNFLFETLLCSFLVSLVVAGLFPALTLLFIYAFMRDKPSGYVVQFFEATRLDLKGKGLLNTPSGLFRKLQRQPSCPDGFITHNQIIYNLDSASPKAVKVLAVYGPSLECPVSALNQVENTLRSLLPVLSPEMSLQVISSTSCNHEEELLSYHEATQDGSSNEWTTLARDQMFLGLADAQEKGELRREKVLFCLTAPLPPSGQGKDGFEKSVEVSEHNFKTAIENFTQSIKILGGSVEVLDNDALFEECHHHLNPSVTKFGKEMVEGQFHREGSIMENSLAGDMVPIARGEGGFKYDSNVHGILVIKALPQLTYSGIITQLTNLPLDNFRVTLNIEALDVLEQIELLEKKVNKLSRALRHSSNIRMQSSLEMLNERIQRLMSNESSPFQVQIIVHAWAETHSELQSKISALKAGIAKLQGAKPYEISLPTSSRNYFFSSMPGSPRREDDFWQYIEDGALANLIPITAQSKESTKGTESFFLGSNNSLVSINTFHGKSGSESPTHAMAIGQTGGGKSCGNIQLLSQTEYLYDFTIIMEEGNSYGTYVRTFGEGARSLIFEPNGKETFNYLDTCGMPLDHQLISEATLILFRMCGEENSESRNFFKTAFLSSGLRKFYAYWSGQKRNPELDGKLGRLLVALNRFPSDKTGDTKPFELFDEYRGWSQKAKDEDSALLDAITEDDAKKALSRATDEELMALSYAVMQRGDQPTHSDFCDWLECENSDVVEHQTDRTRLVESLKAWGRTGRYGKLFDGVSTIDYSGKVLHLELGKILDGDDQLRSIIPLIITNAVMKCIIQRPRGQRKRVVMEELGSFLEKVKGGKQLVKDFYERSRKYNVFCMAVIQQISNLPDDLKNSVIGNLRQGFIYKQKYEVDARAIQTAFGLPDSTIDILMSFPEPSKERGAPFIHWQNTGATPQIRVCYNVASPEMLYVSSSTASHHDKREKALSKYGSVVEGVIAETAKNKEE